MLKNARPLFTYRQDMSWISNLQSPGHITEALRHYNQARADMNPRQNSVQVARSLFDALDKLQNEWKLQQTQSLDGEMNAFRTMLTNELTASGPPILCDSEELTNLVSLEPMIMNHGTLIRHGYRPGLQSGPDLKASSDLEKKTGPRNRLESGNRV